MTRVYIAEKANYANITVQVVQSAGLADLLVYRNDEAGSESHDERIWTFVPERQNAHIAIYFIPLGHGQAHLRIAYVNKPSLAGWAKRHKLRGRLRSHHPERAAS